MIFTPKSFEFIEDYQHEYYFQNRTDINDYINNLTVNQIDYLNIENQPSPVLSGRTNSINIKRFK